MKRVQHANTVVLGALASLVVILLMSPRLGWTQVSIDAPLAGNTRTGAFQVAGFFCVPDGLQPEDVTLTMSFDSGPSFPVSYGNERGDTIGVCAGETRNGFVAQWNYNILGTGPHSVEILADTGTGPEIVATSSFSVVTLGEEFATGLPTPRATVNNWPNQGQRIQLRWEQGIQNWTIISRADNNVTGEWLFAFSPSGTRSGQCGNLGSLFENVNMELDIVEGAAGPDGRPFSGRLREVETAASEVVTFNANGTAQANGDFTFSTDQLVNALADNCTQLMSMTGSGNFPDRSVEASLLVSTQNCPEAQTVSCTATYTGSISLP